MKCLRFTEPRPVETGKDGAGGYRRASLCCTSAISRLLPALVAILVSLYIRQVQIRVPAKLVQIWPKNAARRAGEFIA